MKFLNILCTILCYLIILNGQSQELTYEYEEDCNEGSMFTMNQCLSHKLDSFNIILEKKLACVIFVIDSNISFHAEDSLRFEYIKMKQIVLDSHQYWLKLKEKNAEFPYTFYTGTTLSNMIGNSYLWDIKDRIKRLNDFLEFAQQGHYINCK